MVTLVGTHERVMDQVFSLCLVAREYHRVAAQWPQQSDHVKAAAAVHAPYTELEAVLIPASASLSAALNHLCGSLGRRVCCGGHAGAGDRASASKPKRATSLSFDLVELSCSLESFPFTLGATACATSARCWLMACVSHLGMTKAAPYRLLGSAHQACPDPWVLGHVVLGAPPLKRERGAAAAQQGSVERLHQSQSFQAAGVS